MSFYEDYVEDGLACYACCQIIFDGPNGEPTAPGFPRLCAECAESEPAEGASEPAQQRDHDRQTNTHRRAHAQKNQRKPG